jgi:hypothetical protein
MDTAQPLCYHVTMVTIERVQTGVRLERSLLKVLKALAEYLDISLGDLLEGIVLHAFEQAAPFDDKTIATIDKLKQIYGLHLTAADSHQHQEPVSQQTKEDEDDATMQKSTTDRHGHSGASSRPRVRAVHTQR